MALPPVVDHAAWRRELDELRAREKAATRELDAIAAQRRRLPMVRMPEYTLVGAEGPVRLVDIFGGKSQLIVYNHMWDPGAEWQCGGCTSFTSSFTRLGFLDNYDARFVIVTQGPIDEALAYAKRVGNTMTWYSTADSPFGADVDAPPGGGFALNVFLRDGETVYRTWHTSGRGVEQLTYTFALADVLPYGRQEEWQDSPDGWPQTSTYSAWLDSPDVARLYGPATTDDRAESPTQTVQRLFALLSAGKTGEAAALFADSVSFSIAHPPGIPWVPEVDSAEGMRTFFELLGAHVQPKEFDLRDVIAEGDDVVLIGRMVSEVKKTGRDIDTAFALHTTVQDGRITRYHLYEDSHAVARAYFGD